MKLTSLQLEHFRNLSQVTFLPSDGVNILYGNNAQGKTNMMEAIWMFTGNRSFRGNRQSELISFDQKNALLSMTFQDNKREQRMQIKMGQKKEILLNGVPQKSRTALAGQFFCVIFSPDDLDFVKGSPGIRRKFLDEAIGQINPQYLDYLDQYQQHLEQRNALLKQFSRDRHLADLLSVWDEQLAKLGTILSIYRGDYIKKLKALAAPIYHELSGFRECFSIQYQCSGFDTPVTVYDEGAIAQYRARMAAELQQDMRQGFTGIGIHRDDLLLTIDQKPVKAFGSQGQRRSSVLAVKLSEASLLKKVTGQMPVMLLDDVMSELDPFRQAYILNHVKESQVFITCCDYANTAQLQKGTIFKVEEGTVTVWEE